MRQRMQTLLACPIDGTPLDLVPWEAHRCPLDGSQRARAEAMEIDPSSLETDVETGLLVNHARRLAYPIFAGVPRLLVFRTDVASRFERQFGERLRRQFPGYRLPAEAAAPGEEAVLRSFSREWLDYQWDGESYWNLTPEQLYRSMDVMLDLEARPVRHGRVLEVGIGIGGIADHVARSQECELVGLDLSHAVDAARRHFAANPFLHVVQASVFAPPLPEGGFDLVYSHGVLHHTFSTRAAFEKLVRLPKRGGRLYIWVYSPEDENRTLVRRGLMLIERILRPVSSRLPEPLQTALLLPLVPLYMAHQNQLTGRGPNGGVRYGFNEALHAARDRFTPRYVHRHTSEEIAGWFGAAAYDDVRSVTERPLPDFLPASFTHCAGVDGVRR